MELLGWIVLAIFDFSVFMAWAILTAYPIVL